MISAIKVIKEQIRYFYLVRRLSLFEMISANRNNYLGIAWELLTPAILIMIYWVVFGVGIRDRGDIEVGGEMVPFIFFLISGYIMFKFFSKSVTSGSKSVFSRLKMMSKMDFPMSIMPTIAVCSAFYVHIGLVVIAVVVFLFNGYPLSIYYLQIPYYAVSAFILLVGIALITSTLSTMIRDVHMFITSTTRMLLYLSPILWDASKIAENDDSTVAAVVSAVVRLNPLTYLIEGYRAALFGLEWHFADWGYTLYFWVLTIVIFIIGSMLHMKFRKHFIDYL